jgi:hypothetical protein
MFGKCQICIGYVHGGVVKETRYSSAHGGGRRNCLLA